MYNRSIFQSLESHLADKEVTVITGMRRTGKTTALRFLLDKVLHTNKIYLDLERLEYRRIFNQNNFSEMQADLQFLGIDFTKESVIALDEIQLVPPIVSFIKYYHDHFSVKFIVTGSSSYYLKNQFTESLAGRKKIFEMYPLDFIEFLRFKEIDEKPLLTCRFQPFRAVVYAQYKAHYEEFIRFGGFPQVVLADSIEKKESMLNDILNAYLELDVKLLSDYSVIDDLYRLVTLLASRIGNKLDYQKIGVLLGLSRHKIKDYIQLFEATYFLHLISPFSNNSDRNIAVQPKNFLADTGLVNRFAQVSSGALFENTIALQLLRLGRINYFQKKTGQEIDFILNNNIAIEVKETPAPTDLKILIDRATDLNIRHTMLIGRFPPGTDFSTFIWGGCAC
jgi:predicted AAA+ superfamily ATPase